ncbi:hypothetical protein JKJ11_01005 [Vibrio sp. SCSIO 43133]|uniref:DUF5681 domain-containing protein n=1 Tax=Vibrio sp. SCSIO 43133 TaxID=2802577 RepID=UPI002075B3C9|nr:DUF5681 domain-containing protein [Vibrio sp. SCSIO 43133]USE00700.1 hypothetical protein JKJ11_01005 [Vibrio sp. SCSIO 43133]
MAFKKGESGNPNGRPTGSKNKRGKFDEKLTSKAIENIRKLVDAGDYAASVEVLKRTHPTLKPITPEGSIDAEYINARIFELTELEERLSALEAKSHESN